MLKSQTFSSYIVVENSYYLIFITKDKKKIHFKVFQKMFSNNYKKKNLSVIIHAKSIEHKIARTILYEEGIDEFTSLKARRTNFYFKF